MLNCREATQLASEARDRKLRPGERIGLGFHLLLCALCRRYAREIGFITRLIRVNSHRMPDAGTARLDDAARERIRRRLG